jgi:hypothetical protein
MQHRTYALSCLLALLFAAGLGAACGDADSPPSDGAPATPAASAENTLSDAETEAGWELLFDGSTTRGWRGYNRDAFPTKGWAVEDGQLVITASDPDAPGFAGDIVTQETFGDFELQLDFMLADTANSGILYRVVEQDSAAIWHNAPEYQILDDETYLAMGAVNEGQLTAANYDMHPPAVRALKPNGTWNHARLVVDGNHVEHWLNGQQILEYELESPDWEQRLAASKFAVYPNYGRAESGLIGLQDHGHEVRFRNIKVRRL